MESINFVIDDTMNQILVATNFEEYVIISPSLTGDINETKNEYNEGKKVNEEAWTSLVKRPTHTAKNHQVANIIWDPSKNII